MEHTHKLDEALALALKLSPRERIHLIERIASSIERDIESQANDSSWGQGVVRLLEQLGPIEMVHPEIEDATEWVKQIRHDQDVRRGIDWDAVK